MIGILVGIFAFERLKLITFFFFQDLKTILGIAPADVKVHTNPDGADLPPILTAHIGNDPSKATLLVYGHLDVQPAPDP